MPVFEGATCRRRISSISNHGIAFCRIRFEFLFRMGEMHKRLYVLIFIGLMAGSAVSWSAPGLTEGVFIQEFPESAVSSVSDGLSSFLGKIPKSRLLSYGFLSEAELQQATLGSPFLLYRIQPHTILKYKEEMAIGEMLEKTSQWFFPVVVNREIRAMLLVHEREDGTFTAVSFGYVALAKQIHRLFASESRVHRSQWRLVVVYQAKEFFMARPEYELNKLYPLQVIDWDVKKPSSDLSDNMTRIRPNVKSNLGEGKSS